MPQESTIVFVCEHGGAKSIIAAAYNEIGAIPFDAPGVEPGHHMTGAAPSSRSS